VLDAPGIIDCGSEDVTLDVPLLIVGVRCSLMLSLCYVMLLLLCVMQLPCGIQSIHHVTLRNAAVTARTDALHASQESSRLTPSAPYATLSVTGDVALRGHLDQGGKFWTVRVGGALFVAHTAGLITAEIFVSGNVAVETADGARNLNWNAQHTYVRWETDASPTLDYYLVNITDGQGGVGAAEWRTVQVKTSFLEVFDMPPPVGVTWSWYTLTN
jgi:hypothetical protein